MEFMDLLDEYLELRKAEDMPTEEDWRPFSKMTADRNRMYEIREELNARARGEIT